MRRQMLCALTVAVVVIGLTGVAYADVIAVTPGGTPDVIANSPFALGWEFTVGQPISVTSLGAFDIAGDGHPAGQQVRIYNKTLDTVLTTANIADAAVPESVGGYNVYYQSIAPLALAAGTHYIIAVSNVTASDFMKSASATWASPINYVQGMATLFDPNLPTSVGGFAIEDAGPGYFGAEFKFTAVPEPGSLAMMACGLTALLAYAWRKRG